MDLFLDAEFNQPLAHKKTSNMFFFYLIFKRNHL